MKVYCPAGKGTFDYGMMGKAPPEEIIGRLRDVDAMLNAGKDLAAVLLALEVSESML